MDLRDEEPSDCSAGLEGSDCGPELLEAERGTEVRAEGRRGGRWILAKLIGSLRVEAEAVNEEAISSALRQTCRSGGIGGHEEQRGRRLSLLDECRSSGRD